MNTNDLNTALYEKMAAEQDKFRDWLKRQPPEEILHHTYEYTVREDIVMAMEELELTDAQAQALLESPSPLADVYRYFEKLETGYMDVIRDSIENRADDVCRAKEELRTTPVYPHSAAYAREHGELEQYRASNNANLQCKESIEAAVREHFDGMYLSHDAANGVIEIYGMERVSMVLSNTVQLQDWDGRYSRRNKEWAKTIPNDNPETVRCGYALNSHPAVLDGFIDLLCRTENREQINTPLTELHLNDEMVALLKSGRINNRLLCELATHKDFIKFLADIEIYVDGIATMQIQNLNALVDTVRHEIIERYRPGEDDPHLKVLQAAHISDDEYFSHMVLDDLNLIIRDIRETHKKDSESAPQTTVADELKENLEAVENFKGSRLEKLAMLYCKQLGINYKNLSEEEFRWLIRILQKSKKMGTPISQRKKR